MTDYLHKRNVLTIGSKNGDELAGPSSRLTIQLYMTDYLYVWHVLTIGSENGDSPPLISILTFQLTAPGLQADFSALWDGLFIQAECAYYWWRGWRRARCPWPPG